MPPNYRWARDNRLTVEICHRAPWVDITAKFDAKSFQMQLERKAGSYNITDLQGPWDTEPQWRHRGFGTLLMNTAILYLQAHVVTDTVVTGLLYSQSSERGTARQDERRRFFERFGLVALEDQNRGDTVIADFCLGITVGSLATVNGTLRPNVTPPVSYPELIALADFDEVA